MHWTEYADAVAAAPAIVEPAPLYALAGSIFRVWQEGHTVFTCGNGGSASAASHLAQDLAKGTRIGDAALLRTVCLCDSLPKVTAWANDEGYERIFAEPLRPLGRPGDLLIAISGSGNSENVLQAIHQAHLLAMRTWGICGYDGGKLKQLAHRHVHVACDNMGMVEAVHGIVFHWLIDHLRMAFVHGSHGGFSIMDARPRKD